MKYITTLSIFEVNLLSILEGEGKIVPMIHSPLFGRCKDDCLWLLLAGIQMSFTQHIFHCRGKCFGPKKMVLVPENKILGV